MSADSGINYPGVYIQEVESSVHTIVPVPTATTAFIGRARSGPVNQPVEINSFAEFERIFGGLWLESSLGYAVHQFFLNGGSEAIIVRLYHPETGKTGLARIKIADLTLAANSPGAWGNQLCARITAVDERFRAEAAQQLGVEEDEVFNLAVYDKASKVSEVFAGVTVVESRRRLDKVLEHESTLIAVAENGLPEKAPPAHPEPEQGMDAWSDPKAHSAAEADQQTDGLALAAADYLGDEARKEGLYALEKADLFNLLNIPPYGGEGPEAVVLARAAAYCERRRAVLLVDPPEKWRSKADAKANFPIEGLASANGAIYFPCIQAPNPLLDNQVEEYAPGGAIAGIIARTDAREGVWKAPAGLEANLMGVTGLTVTLTEAENGELNPLGINCLRQFPGAGAVVWGARTLVGDDRLASEWKYLPVRRTALFIEESLYRGTQWAVFEPNDEPLWSQLRLNIGVFMYELFRQGAFQGQSPKEAYFVKCDSTTTTQSDIEHGIVNILVGFAPLKPAEFVILYIQQIAGQISP